MWDMEEEIIGNRWKELDYDGEVTAVAMISSSPRSLTPLPPPPPLVRRRRRPLRGEPHGGGGKERWE